MDDAQRRRVCQLIAGMIIADDIMEPQEEAFLDRVIEKFGFAEEGRDAIFPLVSHEEAAAAAQQLGPVVGQETFAMLMEAAKADDQVVPEELEYLRVVANALGMSEEETNAKLEELKPFIVS